MSDYEHDRKVPSEHIQQHLVAWRGPATYPRVAKLRQMLKAAAQRSGE